MKQYWIRAIVVIFIVASFTACKKEIRGEPQAESLVSVQDSNVELSSKDNTAEMEQSMQIVCNGNDEAVLQITNDEVRKLLDSTDTNSKQYIMIAFFSGNEQKLGLHLDGYGWNLSNTGDNTGAAVSHYLDDGQADSYLISEDTVSIHMNVAAIGELFEECDNYSIMLFDTVNDDYEMLAGGDLSDILTREASDKSMELLYTGAERAVVRLIGEEFTTFLQEHEGENLSVNFYLPDSMEYMPDYVIRLGRYDAKLYQYSYQKMEKGSYTTTAKELLGESYNSAAKTENGYSAMIHYENLKALLSACDRISVTDGQELTFLSTNYKTVISDTADSIVPIPDEFLPCEQDHTYFYPATEDYIVVKITIPKCSFFDYSIGIAPDGNEYYGPVGAHESSVSIISLTSYDEFGITDQKTKIVYDNVTDAMTASATRMDMLPVDRLSGDASDDEIKADFFEQLDLDVLGTPRNQEPYYQYYGHFNNVRYFQSDSKNINYINLNPYFPDYDRATQFDENGYITENVKYQHIYEHIEPGLGYSESREDIESITAFYSKTDKHR